jgi:ATP-dependent Lhr-like helicase
VERPAVRASDPSAEIRQAPRRVIPTTAAPITFYLRESSEWLHHALANKSVDETTLTQSLSTEAQTLRTLLREKGAAFTADLQRLSGLTKLQTSTALWELATAGLASADGFDQLRAMMDPRRKSVAIAQTAATSLRKRAAARTTAGRWSLLCDPQNTPDEIVIPTLSPPKGNDLISSTSPQIRHSERSAQHAAEEPATPPTPASLRAPSASEATARAIAAARLHDAALDAHARILLCRYGVLFRDLLARESNAPKWRELAPILRRLEARGEIRGGRFVSGPFGEQFALPEVIDSLRNARREATNRIAEAPIAVAAADPLNLAGILVPGERVPAIPGRELQFQNGAVVDTANPGAPQPALSLSKGPASGTWDPTTKPKSTRTHSIADILRNEAAPAPRTAPTSSLELFS